MARAYVTVRDAIVDDMPALLELFEELRAAGPRRGTIGSGELEALRASVSERYRRAITSPMERLVVAVRSDESVQGMVLLTVGPANSVVDTDVVSMSHFSVRAPARRGGVGRALIAAATAWAEERGAEGVAVTVYPASRESNRFLARLGFAPTSLVRMAPVSGLRRRLGCEVPAAALDEGHGTRRRRLRVSVTGTRSLAGARRHHAG